MTRRDSAVKGVEAVSWEERLYIQEGQLELIEMEQASAQALSNESVLVMGRRRMSLSVSHILVFDPI